jgi:zinc protease
MVRRPEGAPLRRRARAAAALVFSAALLSGAGLAQTPDSPGSPWKEAPVRLRLATGMDCFYQKDATSPTTVIELVVPGGRGVLPEGRDGLAYLVTRLCLEIPDFDKARDLMIQATRLSMMVYEDCSVLSLSCLSENLEPGLAIASSIIQSPLMTGLRIDHTKDTMALLSKAAEDDAVITGHGAALGALFGGRGYGSAAFGTPASLKLLDKKSIAAFFGRRFVKTRLFFSVCSDLDPGLIKAQLEKAFSKFPAGESGGTPDPAEGPSLPEGRTVDLEKDTKQTYISRVFLLPAPAPADFARGSLLEVLLGKGPGSRMWTLRTPERLAYDVNARATWTLTSGILEAYLETDKAKRARAAESLDGVLRRLYEDGITAEELETTKTLASASTLRGIETKEARARTMALWQVLGLGFDRIAGIFRDLQAVTLGEMNAYIRSVLDPSRSISVAVGPKAPV